MFPNPRRLTNNFTESPDGGLVSRHQQVSTTKEGKDENQRRTWTRLELLSQISQVTDGLNTGAGRRRFHSKFSQLMDPTEFTNRFTDVLDQVNLKNADKLEEYLVTEIQTIRNDVKQPDLRVSEHLRQLGKAQSQYFCGNCLRVFNDVPYPTLSFSIKLNDRDSVKTYSEKLAAYWKMKDISDFLNDASLTEIGIGVWGTSQTMIVTIVTIFTP